jgi:serine/threonine-protein kinase
MPTKKKIGKGLCAKVTLIEDPNTHELIALKTYNSPPTTDLSETFMTEANIVMACVHPCVTRVVGYGLPVAQHPPQIGMQFAERGSLQKALDARHAGKGTLSETDVAIIVCGIVLGLRHIHSCGLIHRELKPSQILIDARGYASVADLANRRLADVQIAPPKQLVSAIYMSPDMYEDAPPTAACDVWSFTVMFYELLVNDWVFPPGLSPVALMKKVMDPARPELPDGMDSTVKEIIQKGWAQAPADRLSSAEIWTLLESINFKITPGVDSDKVLEFVAWVHQNENAE